MVPRMLPKLKHDVLAIALDSLDQGPTKAAAELLGRIPENPPHAPLDHTARERGREAGRDDLTPHHQRLETPYNRFNLRQLRHVVSSSARQRISAAGDAPASHQ